MSLAIRQGTVVVVRTTNGGEVTCGLLANSNTSPLPVRHWPYGHPVDFAIDLVRITSITPAI